MISSAIILAGGFGTRLQSVVKDMPKPMAGVAGKPFLQYLLDDLSAQGITSAILSVGYKWESVQNYFGDQYKNISLSYSVETEPLGTGGAILKAVMSSTEEEFFVFNGDTFFSINLSDFRSKHLARSTNLSLALKHMENFDRYGVVRTDDEDRIISFEEKKFYSEGNINGGIYILNRKLFESLSLPGKFSFEKELMEKYCSEMKFCGFSFDDYFIDIGIPQDYARAQLELPDLSDKNSRIATDSLPFIIDKSWTLFLDRDGVINRKIENDYVRNRDQFEWLPGVKESLLKFSKIFGRVIIVSNQQGVGKGLMTINEVDSIHEHIIESVSALGGKIDRIYYAPQLKEENSEMRKPNTGMARRAKEDFPEIDFSKSIIVGDSMSDMEFGKKAGMKTVFVSHNKPFEKTGQIDLVVNDLPEFTEKIFSDRAV